MKQMIPAALIAMLANSALATSEFAGERFTGTHTYRFDQQTWSPMPEAGWRTVTMVGDYAPASGPITASSIECRGTTTGTVQSPRPTEFACSARGATPGCCATA